MSSRFLAAGLAALILTSAVLANAPAPIFRPPVVVNSAEAKLVVQVDANAKKPILKVPATLVQKAPQPRPGGQALLDNPTLLVAGLALACAFVSGGFWLLRGKGGRATVAILAVAGLALAGGFLTADLRPPPLPPQLPAIALPAKVDLSGDVTIQVYASPLDQNIYLVLPGPADKAPGAAPPGAKPE